MGTGSDHQHTGDEGETAVEHALRKAGFMTGRLSPDPGEDLWVEVEGHRAATDGSFPYRALVQAKASRRAFDDTFTYDIETKHLRRWAAQPLPIFVVGVDLSTERFFVKSVDAILAQDLDGKDVGQLTTLTARVHLPFVDDLGGHMRVVIVEHYRSSQLVLAGLRQDLIEQDYFEVLERTTPEPWEKVPVASWKVMWKSPRRPQHLAAMATELSRQAAQAYADARPRPAFVVFHIYRSQFDLQRNLAAVRVDWVDPSHPKAGDIIEILGVAGGFRFRMDKDVDASREVARARTSIAPDYTRFAAEVGGILDELTDAITARPLLDAWDDPLAARFDQVDKIWDNGPDAPPECAQLDEMIKAHHGALFDSYFVARIRRGEIPPATAERLLRQSLDRMRQCRGAWRVFVR